MIKSAAQQYVQDFSTHYVIDINGALVATDEKLSLLESWFNNSYLLISLISGIPLEPIHFEMGTGLERKKTNDILLLQSYAVSYAALLRLCFTLGIEVPAQFKLDI